MSIWTTTRNINTPKDIVNLCFDKDTVDKKILDGITFFHRYLCQMPDIVVDYIGQNINAILADSIEYRKYMSKYIESFKVLNICTSKKFIEFLDELSGKPQNIRVIINNLPRADKLYTFLIEVYKKVEMESHGDDADLETLATLFFPYFIAYQKKEITSAVATTLFGNSLVQILKNSKISKTTFKVFSDSLDLHFSPTLQKQINGYIKK